MIEVSKVSGTIWTECNDHIEILQDTMTVSRDSFMVGGRPTCRSSVAFHAPSGYTWAQIRFGFMEVKITMRVKLQVAGVATLVVLVALMAAALTVWAAPGTQTAPDPTPTLYPLEPATYTLERVGGVDEVLTYEFADQGAFTFDGGTATSVYPRGMIFTIKPQSTNGTVNEAILFYRFVHDSGSRLAAEWDADGEQWVAHLWANGEGQQAWTNLRFHWRVRDETGAYVDTEEYEVDYWDPHREWWRMESADIIMYWFGFYDDDPDFVAQHMADEMAQATARQIAGFGRRLSYKPITTVYPDRDTYAETVANGVVDPFFAGRTSNEQGISLQVLRGDYVVTPGNEECVWNREPGYWTLERRVLTLGGTAAHEVTHLYQYDVIGGANGLLWVYEGQAEFFSNDYRNGDERLTYLATIYDLPSLQVGVGSRLPAADGCTALAYVVGPSFWNHLNLEYGGMETIAEIIRMQRAQKSIFEAVEAITGKTFLEVENEWRVKYGWEPLTLADVDPALALEPYEDGLLAVGDTVTLPAMPPLVKMNEDPGERAMPGPQCFGNTPVTILRMGALNGVAYFEIDCMGMVGWVTRDQLVGP